MTGNPPDNSLPAVGAQPLESDQTPSAPENEVGYGKPPKHSQFKKGQSGNPRGRRKGVNNLKTDVLGALKAPVLVRGPRSSRKISTQEAALARLREQALKGDPRALDRLLNLAASYNNEAQLDAADRPLSPVQREELDAYLAILRGSSILPDPPFPSDSVRGR